MRILGSLIVLGLALLTSLVAGTFSVIGLATLFSGAFWPVVILGTTLEAAKIAAAGWLHAHWRDPTVSRLHRGYLTGAVVVLMTLTSLGIYGFLAKAHLAVEAPVAAVHLRLDQIDQRIAQARAERDRAATQITQIDQSVAAAIAKAKVARDAAGAASLRASLRKERAGAVAQVAETERRLDALTAEAAPLRASASDAASKLGPLRYVADLFGWTDPAAAVRLIILLVMIAFDPLAIMLVLSGLHTLRETEAPSTPAAPPSPEPAPAAPKDTEPFLHQPAIDETSYLGLDETGGFVWKTPPTPDGIPVYMYEEPSKNARSDAQGASVTAAERSRLPEAVPATDPAPAPARTAPVAIDAVDLSPDAPAMVGRHAPFVRHSLPAFAPPPPDTRPVPPVLSPDDLDDPMTAPLRGSPGGGVRPK